MRVVTLLSAVIIGASIIGAIVIAPYQVNADPDAFYRLNTITGQIAEYAFPDGLEKPPKWQFFNLPSVGNSVFR